MEFDNEDNDSLFRTMELSIGESLSHGRKRLSLNVGPNLHVPKLKSKSPTMHENQIARASIPPMIIHVR